MRPPGTTWQAAALASALLSVPALAGADAIKLTNGLTYDQVAITDVSNGVIIYVMPNGQALSRGMAEVAQVTLTGNDAFNEAEALMQEGKCDEAAGAYTRAESGVSGWRAALIAHRLLVAAEGAGKADVAVRRWLTITDAGGAQAAALALRPRKLAPAGDKANDAAIALLANKVDLVKSPAYQRAIRELLVDLYQRQGRLAEAQAMAKALAEAAGVKTQPAGLGPTGAGERPEPTGPAAKPGVAAAQLRLASLAMQRGQHAEVVRMLEGQQNSFTAAELPVAL